MTIGLYYPYVHFRDLAWIKAAALYMPRVARVVPRGFHVSDPAEVRTLREGLDFVKDFDPADAVAAASGTLQALVDERGPELRRAFGVEGGHGFPEEPVAAPTPPIARANRGRSPDASGTTGVHRGEMTDDLLAALEGAGLARSFARGHRVRGDGAWIGVDPALAWVYKCALTAEVAARTAFVPLTDQVAAHTAADPWDAERMGAVLLEGTMPFVAAPDLNSQVGLLSLEYVLPARLGRVSADTIVQLRTDYEAEFLAYTDAVEHTARALRDSIGDVRDRNALDLHLRDAVHQDFEMRLDDLRKAMNGIGLQTITTAVSTKFEIPTLVGAAGSAVGGAMGTATSVAGGVAMAAFGLFAGARRQMAAEMKSNPASFLLRVERGLAPTTLWKRIRRTLQQGVMG
ncbi:DUF6236 family protein [Streptomyces sp. NPDC004286]|uniref:DUF6236 family protein n=1 Tax=Streptomyces sp. NPDC004286 TaxID=3364696 RepID=UPI003694A18A